MNAAAATYLPKVTVVGKRRTINYQKEQELPSIPKGELNQIINDRVTTNLEKLQKLKELEFKYDVWGADGWKQRLNSTYQENIRTGTSLDGKIFRGQLAKGILETLDKGFAVVDMVSIGMSQRGGGLEIPFIGGVTQLIVSDLSRDMDEFMYENALTRGSIYMDKFVNTRGKQTLMGVYTSKEVMMTIIQQGGILLTKNPSEYSLTPTAPNGKKFDFYIFFSKKQDSKLIKNFGVLPTK